jgi:hypothetical protein
MVVLGNRGMGKTNFGSVLAEELSKCRLHFSIIDPMGVWWGLQSSKDGKGPGIPVLLLGGIRGDIPIEPTAGSICADLVVDENVNVVIDISRHANGKAWSKGEKIRFVTAYTLRLYERQVEKVRPLLQIYDEAARYIPQKISFGDKEISECMGAIQMLTEEGRNIGVGVCFLTQRSARINKDVTELCEILIAFRTIGPNSVEAVTDWLGAHLEKQKIKDRTEELRTLPIGSALAVSPGWLQFEGVIKIRERETFDSSKTPKPGEHRIDPVNAAKPNLDKYLDLMKETVERVKANDPKLLKSRLAQAEQDLEDLREQLKTASSTAECNHGPEIESLRGENNEMRIAVKEAERRINDEVTRVNSILQTVYTTACKVTELLDFGVDESISSIQLPDKKTPAAYGSDVTHKQIVSYEPPRSPNQVATVLHSGNGVGDESLNKGERKVLIAIAQYQKGISRGQLSVLTDYKRSSRNTYVSTLTSKGYVITSGDNLVATQAGINALGRFERLPTGAALVQYYMNRLRGGELVCFQDIVAAGRAGKEREQVASDTYKRSSRNTYISKLVSREAVVAEGSRVRLADLLL